MEIFLILLLIILGYLVWNLRFSIVPPLRVISKGRCKQLKGKLIQSDVVLLPIWGEENRSLSKDGLCKSLEVDVLAGFDSVEAETFCIGKLELVALEYFKSHDFGPYGIIASLTKISDGFVRGRLMCSHQTYDLIKGELGNMKVVMLRVEGRPGLKSDRETPTIASNVRLLLQGEISAESYLFERFRKKYQDATASQRKDLQHFEDLLRRYELSADR